jgi:hypothetical protein
VWAEIALSDFPMGLPRFYSVAFPDSKATAVHEAPGDYPGGRKGDVLTVEFTVLGIPYLGLNGGPAGAACLGNNYCSYCGFGSLDGGTIPLVRM